MPHKKPSGQVDLKLAQLTGRELVELYRQIGRELVHGDKVNPAQRIKEVKAEVDRRICQNDPEMDAIGAEDLRAGELRLVPPLPTEIESVTPEHAATLKDREVIARLEEYKRMLEFDIQTYPELTDVQDWLAHGMLKQRREKLEAAIRCLAHEMMRRGLVPKRAGSSVEVRGQVKEPSRSGWYESHPDVLRRRQIVLKNPSMRAKSLCTVFDRADPPIPLPGDWSAEFRVGTWFGAYKNKKGRGRILKIISTDRHSRS